MARYCRYVWLYSRNLDLVTRCKVTKWLGLGILASPRIEHMKLINQNMPIFILYEETFANGTGIQNRSHLFYSICGNKLFKRHILAKYLQNISPRDDVARTNVRAASRNGKAVGVVVLFTRFTNRVNFRWQVDK